MKIILLLVALFAVSALGKVNLEEYGSEHERKEAIEAAIQESKDWSHARQESAKIQTADEKQGKYTAAQLLSKFFKRPSPEAKKVGEARLRYEQMVYRAERKLSEMRRNKMASTQSATEKAEAIAEELFHKPGTLLTENEIARMWQESECEELRERPRCNFPTVNRFRTIDGTCNNRKTNPLFGSAGTIFKRLIPPVYEDGCYALRGARQSESGEFFSIGPFAPPNPSARFVSQTIVNNITNDELPFSHLLMQWGQFLDHDLDLSPELEAECEGCETDEICQPIRVADEDVAFGLGTQNNANCIPLRRSLPACEIDRPLSFFPREQTNDITSFIDGSMVYGSRPNVAASLREFKDGLLRVGPNFPGNQPSLPVDNENLVACLNAMDCFLCGDVRCNEQISLTVMHTYWVREHNRCARELANINTQWGDERLYQECRKIVGAIIQKITFVDYLPKIFGYEQFETFIKPYEGYDPLVDAGVPNSFATAAYRYGHSLVRPKFDRLDVDYNPLPIGPLNLRDMFFNPDQYRISLGSDPIARGWLSANSRRVDEFVNRVLTTQLFQTPASPGLDLASLNIQRGRDHGLPGYNTFLRFCQKAFPGVPFNGFENQLTFVKFLGLYGSLDTLDLWVAGLAEERLEGSLLGPTFACLFGLTFQAVRDGDRFWYERPAVFTRAQRKEIQKATLSRVLCDNSDKMLTIQPDAFLTNQTRVDCDSLPSVDLRQWEEEACFARIEISPFPNAEQIMTLSRSVSPQFLIEAINIAASTSSQFKCIPVECPLPGVPTDLVFAGNPWCVVTPDSDLPPSVMDSERIFRASVSEEFFDSRPDGLFRTEAACMSGRDSAATFSPLPGARAQQSDYDDGLSPEIVDILDEENEYAEEENYHTDDPAAVQSDSELLRELESALLSVQ